MTKGKKLISKKLQIIPGVGKSIAEDLISLNVLSVSDLIGKDPQKLYDDLCVIQQQKIDRCMLYVMRCAVYFATEKTHDPEKLKWWNWKD
ncbi:MAG: helix-hairpin-helix domain-containing protein [Candidatus Roizmanbacteria bacterium]